jgi:hypothetical protein
MTHSTAEAGGHREDGSEARLEPLVITALFDSREAIDAALRRLHAAGVPRDLIEVVVSREASERFYGGRARTPRREVFRYAGIGGLAGLIIAAGLSLAIVAMPGWEPPATTAVVQLLGPNIGAVVGAALGALFGAFRRPKASRRHARAAESESAILLLVHARADAEVVPLEEILTSSGGRETRVET